MNKLEDYDFDYPETAVAASPAEPRDSARLLVVDRAAGRWEHSSFRDLRRHLRPGDCLVLNRTRVWPARLEGRKATGGRAELLLVSERGPGVWLALASGLKPGMDVAVNGVSVRVEALDEDGLWVCRFSDPDVLGLMARAGRAPLPPYILRRRRGGTATGPVSDAERYQTVYAREEGSIAAPTAGLHFTPKFLDELRAAGVETAELVLHVGRGTFRPVKAADIRDHRMLPEWCQLGPEAAASIEACRRRGGRVVAVGTTVTRCLESWAATGRTEGWTDLFIRPGHRFASVDALLTNFHLPRSTPLVLAAAFAGGRLLLDAYKDAVASGYRLFSYGDATLLA